MVTLPHDITRCTGTTCGKRDTCARFLDSPTDNPMQSYADLSPTAPPYLCPFYIKWEGAA